MSRIPTLTVSIVSHGQAVLAGHVMRDLERCTAVPLEVVLTLNVPERLPFDPHGFPYPVTVLENPMRKGFGANHNAAFRVARGEYFCVLNPDIRLERDPFPLLIAELVKPGVAAAAPRIVDAEGATEDSARRFPTLATIARKAVTGFRGDSEYLHQALPFSPDWIAGMFMLVRAAVYREVGGFDERYYLYYEDVDLCARLRRRGYDIRAVPAATATHLARRESHRNPRYLAWHVSSLLRFLLTSARLRKKNAA